jgi:putative spermidine/putrescine transport system ATP-binding protein
MTAARSGRKLKLVDIEHRFGSTVALSKTSLIVEPGELLVLLGPSGCGKTTLLRAVAGLLIPSGGTILVNEANVSRLPPEDRRVGIVFQNFALFPHMTVAQNIAYGLEARGHARKTIERKVAEMLAVVRMEGLAERYPRQLSGGQQQRAALARALAIEPELLLLDEPFGALDKNLRLEMQIEVRRIQRELGITTVMVTHDQDEALSMSDRIAVMNHGRIVQCGTPSEIYDHPADLFVSSFIGNMNIIPAELVAANSHGTRLRMDNGFEFQGETCGPYSEPGRVLVAVRPENMEIGEGDVHGLAGQVQFLVSLEKGALLTVLLPFQADRRDPRVGDSIRARIRANAPYKVFAP